MELGIAQLTFTSGVKLYTDELAKLVRARNGLLRAAQLVGVLSTGHDWTATRTVVCVDLFGWFGVYKSLMPG